MYVNLNINCGSHTKTDKNQKVSHIKIKFGGSQVQVINIFYLKVYCIDVNTPYFCKDLKTLKSFTLKLNYGL